MRKRSPLDPLIPRTIQEVLTAILVEREKPWYLNDLAKRLQRTPSTLQRPLAILYQAGIIRRWTDGNRVYFAREPSCPILPDLQQLLIKTVGLADTVKDALQPVSKKINLAFIYGSVARDEERSQSDVDLFVVSSLTLAKLAPCLARAEKNLRRSVNAVILSAAEFSQRFNENGYFLQSVLDRPKIFLVGTPHDLEKLTGKAARRSP